MKNLWTGIKAIINRKSKTSLQNISQLVVDDKTHTDPQDIANIFNKFFVNVSIVRPSPKSKVVLL